MGYIDIDLGGYVEPQVVKELDQVYTLKIRSAEEKEIEFKKGGTGQVIDLLCAVTDSGLENPSLIRHTIWLPGSNDTFEQKNSRVGQIIRFKKAIGDVGVDGKPTAGLNTDNIVGCEFKAMLKLTHDDTYGDKNEIKRIVTV